MTASRNPSESPPDSTMAAKDHPQKEAAPLTEHVSHQGGAVTFSGLPSGKGGKVEISQNDPGVYAELGYSWPEWKKWCVLSVIFIVQVSMNFNTSLYSNNLENIQERFNVGDQAARVGAMIFLILYAFGCELWAPWSEEFGRWPILQLSLFLVNIWQILAGLAPNFGSLLVARALGGLSSAGGSVTLGMIADLWEADDQQFAVAFVVFSSVGGSVLGPIVGGFSEAFLGYSWNFWIQLIFGGFVQVLHFFTPETRSTILMDRIAKRRRLAAEKAGEPVPNIWGPGEVNPFRERFSFKEVIHTWIRPFHMFIFEPIVLFLSLLSGFSDALIFMFLQSFALIYNEPRYGFGVIETNLSFIAILVGYIIAYASFIPAIQRNKRERAQYPDDERKQFESRLWWLTWTAPCLWIGLFGFAWTTLPELPWIASMIFVAVIGIANYAIYMATIDYMIAAYGVYSASATGGNGFARDFLAGVLTLAAKPFFTNIGADRDPAHTVNYASTVLACIAFLVTIPVYVFYFKGDWFRARSKFATDLIQARKANDGRVASISEVRRLSEVRSNPASRQASFAVANTSTLPPHARQDPEKAV